VFFIQDGMTDEQLLYDFSLRVGDTIKGFLFPNGPNGITVYSIDSILLDSIYHRRINSGAIQLIEGVGSTQGLIEPLTYDPLGWLICFNKNGETVYYNNIPHDSCNIVNGIELHEQQQSRLTLYPNPSTDQITIETSSTPTNSQLSIMNLNGQEILTCQITESKTTIDISTLPSGVYFVRLTNDKTVEVGKFVKQ
jgi:hypothetical protein